MKLNIPSMRVTICKLNNPHVIFQYPLNFSELTSESYLTFFNVFLKSCNLLQIRDNHNIKDITIKLKPMVRANFS